MNSEYYQKLQQQYAEEAGLSVVAVPINSSNEMSVAVLSMVEKDIDCIYQISDNLTSIGFEAEVKIANEMKLPIFCNQITEVERGAAIGLGWSYYTAGYEAGKLAIRVVEGEDPAEIPIQYMDKTKMHVNLTAAEEQGLVIPQEILDSADKIFE